MCTCTYAPLVQKRRSQFECKYVYANLKRQENEDERHSKNMEYKNVQNSQNQVDMAAEQPKN